MWQYGSDENKEPISKQDGIAPQITAGGLDETHRVYIPDGITKGFYESHNIENYKWIFEKKDGDAGFVKPRK